jgi:hypothetical protein
MVRNVESLATPGTNDHVCVVSDGLESPVLILATTVIILDNMGAVVVGPSLYIKHFAAVS